MARDEGGRRATESTGGRRRDFETVLAGYIERLTDGELLDPDALRDDHPDIAEELLESLEAFVEAAPAQDPLPPLGTLGDYTLRRQIGRGGMGVVYEAWQASMDRRVALKVLPSAVAADEKAFNRFMREAKIAGKLDHKNVVAVHAAGFDENTPYYAMEYVEGETLAQVLARTEEIESGSDTAFGGRDGARYFENLARAFADVADGLQHAHSRGVVHRDVKPSNLILDHEGRLRILDFGLARLEGQETLTLTGDVVGTPLYMSPEQARRKKVTVDHRTDIYSLGATMYEALTGRPPFRGKDHAETLSQIITSEPVEPRKLNPRVPEDLETVVLKCLRKDVDDRYGTSEALAQDLRRFVRGDPIEARPQARLEKLLRRLWRHRRAVAATLFLVTLAFAGLVLSLILVWGAKAQTEDALDEARRNLRVADEAVRELLNWVGDRRFLLVPETEPMRRELLEKALEFHDIFVAANPADPQILLSAARAQARVGQIYQLVGQVSEARAAYERSIESTRQLLALPSGSDQSVEHVKQLADVESLLGLLDRSGVPDTGAAVRRYPVGKESRGVVDVAIADLDHDRLDDIVALDRHSADARILWNVGNREFDLSESLRVGRDAFRLEVCDLDGDGDVDLVSMNLQEGTLSILINQGERRFADAVEVEVEYMPWDVAAADFDGDGRDEVAVVGLGVRLLDWRPDGSLTLSETLKTEGFPNSIFAGDIDGDGHPDLVVGSHRNLKGFLWVVLNDGRGGFSSANPTVVSCPSIPGRLVAADFNGDGLQDLAASDRWSGHLFVALNTQGGTFEPGVRYPVGRNHIAVTAADLDGDGHPDVATACEDNGTVSLFLSDGAGRFSSVARFLTGGHAFLGDAGDLDGDGQIDLAVANGFADDVAVMYDLLEVVTKTAEEPWTEDSQDSSDERDSE